MAQWMDQLSAWFWNDQFWLPEGVSFRDLQDRPGFHYAKPRDLFVMPIYAVFILCIRYLYDKYLAKHFAEKLSIKVNRVVPAANTTLEEAYLRNKRPTEADMLALAKEQKMSPRAVTNWFIHRRNMNRPNLLVKFSEASWRFLFYTFAFTFGMCTLIQSPWFWDNLQCWADYPQQTLWPSVYYYYMLEGGFYMSLVCSLMKDVRRKDFTEQIIHHLATIFLIMFSYVANFVRVGSMVMAIHDISDVFLELAKCFVYAKWERLADNLFTTFAVVFIVSRLFVYPYCILHTTWVKSMWLFTPYAGYYFFNALLMVLQLLHIFWASIIVKMAVRMAQVGKLEKDARSDEDEASVPEDAEVNGKELSNGNVKTSNGVKTANGVLHSKKE